jgi:hypothetical protein
VLADSSALPAGASAGRLTTPLVENLARALDGGWVALWLPAGLAGPRPDHPPTHALPAPQISAWVPVVVRAAVAAGMAPPVAEGASGLDPWAVSGMSELVPVADDQTSYGLLMLGEGPRENHPSGSLANAVAAPAAGAARAQLPPGLLESTLDCLLVLVRELGLAARLRSQEARADVLAARAGRLDEELARVRDSERRRLASALLAAATPALADIDERWRVYAESARASGAVAAAARGPGAGRDPARALRDLRAALDEFVDDFRAVVRAVHPTMLRREGAAAAIADLAADLPREVRVRGDFGRRSGWEVESGLFQATAATLAALSGPAVTPRPALSVLLSGTDGTLRVQVSDPAPGRVADVLAGLAEDARRLVALGGGLRYGAGADGSGTVELWLPEGLLRDDEAGLEPLPAGGRDEDLGQSGSVDRRDARPEDGN